MHYQTRPKLIYINLENYTNFYVFLTPLNHLDLELTTQWPKYWYKYWILNPHNTRTISNLNKLRYRLFYQRSKSYVWWIHIQFHEPLLMVSIIKSYVWSAHRQPLEPRQRNDQFGAPSLGSIHHLPTKPLKMFVLVLPTQSPFTNNQFCSQIRVSQTRNQNCFGSVMRKTSVYMRWSPKQFPEKKSAIEPSKKLSSLVGSNFVHFLKPR